MPNMKELDSQFSEIKVSPNLELTDWRTIHMLIDSVCNMDKDDDITAEQKASVAEVTGDLRALRGRLMMALGKNLDERGELEGKMEYRLMARVFKASAKMGR